ncbi:2-hydroxy-3-oxopropionate reductase [[Actinomadura] parvosata subsp. kistnae]|uniref:2-hydroxy-3-oxopropionate reductase n=1 Tax=[Actinomadura] parvosata subsp. kistnae TaxID=1909395 RepID=A0A1V0A5Y6_9ACTN|nr:2-hydroxy-3-oxopropionate reductase [Nonomuraea sp. ATCC 55076]AQZ65589.1 2-hydroxy-3-oxopropionate reductase [Nonomuraea sp. ATCC 55076]SPL96964.1 2-hydroxy-3-oxopropionate reductase [Actinomadura parvosata subsp. kistnae]
MNIGFVGLGIMGSPMAANLLKAGYVVTGYDVSAERLEQLTALGGKAATGVVDAVAGADVVITMLPDSPQVEEVAPLVIEYGKPNLLYIDMSTIKPETSRWVARQAAAVGVRALDAPVSGGERGAIDGTLSIMVGGAPEDVEAARPVLDRLGVTVVHVGPAGAGQTVKAANQLVVGGIYGLVSEAIVLLEASGVDPAPGLDVLAGGLAGSRILELKRHTMVKREFAPGFRIDLHHKDMGIALAAAREAGVSLPLTGQVAQLVAAARAQGHGALDHSALLKVIERLNA